MIHSLFIMNGRGEVIVEKHWRSVTARSVCSEFWEEVHKASSPEEVLPIIETPSHYLVHVHRNDLFFLAVLKEEVAPMLVIEFLQRVVEVLSSYFGVAADEGAIKDNFVTAYEVLDEMMDNGFPLTTEVNILQEMIRPPTMVSRTMDALSISGQGGGHVSEDLAGGALSNVPWRKAGVRYATNEVYFDLIEELDALVDCNGMVISAEVSASVEVNCRLSGMPDLTLSFADPHLMDDVAFHPCVRYSRYESTQQLSFVPPDGKFRLMSYRIPSVGSGSLPIYIKPSIQYSGESGHIDIMVGPKGNFGKPVEGVLITVPLDKQVHCTSIKVNVGSAKFDEVKKAIIWKIGRMPQKTPCFEGSLVMRGTARDQGYKCSAPAPLILGEFKISGYSVSGVKISGLSVMNCGTTKPYKGVRTITKAGKFQVRTST